MIIMQIDLNIAVFLIEIVFERKSEIFIQIWMKKRVFVPAQI